MDSGSPNKPKEMMIPDAEHERPSEPAPMPVPSNTLQNLAKLNIGTPRFEVNSAANEDGTEDLRETLGAVEERKEEEPVREDGEPEAVVNGNGDIRQQVEVPVVLQVPEDELMRITSEQEPEQVEVQNEESRKKVAEEVVQVEPVQVEVVQEEKIQEEVVQEEVAQVAQSGEEEKVVVSEEVQPEPTPIEEEPVRIEEEVPVETPEAEPEHISEEKPEDDMKIQEEVVQEIEPVGEKAPSPVQEEPAPQENEPEVEAIQPEVVEEKIPEPVEELEVVEANLVAPEPVEEVQPEPEVEEKPESVKQSEPEVVEEPEPVVEAELVPVPEVQVEPVPVVEEPQEVEKSVQEEVVQVVAEPEESEKEDEEENLQMSQPPVMPGPPKEASPEPIVEKEASPEPTPQPQTEPEATPVPEPEPLPEKQIESEKEESPKEELIVEESTPVAPEETNKIEEEQPTPTETEAKNPILVRNEEISADEKDMDFNTQGRNKVFAWGSAECDQFEYTQYESRRPVEIEYFSSKRVKVSKIVCGSQHTLVLDSSGKVHSWGNSDDGVLGRSLDSRTPEARPGVVELDSQVDLISAGDAHSVFANSQTGEVFFSGVIKSSNGKLSRVVDIPESVGICKFRKSGIKSVISGANHVLIHSRYNVYAFGDNSCGALGYILRTYDERSDCLKPHALRLKGIARIFTGAYHCFAITNKGILKTWGLNSQGQLGLPYYFENGEDSDVNHEDPNRNPNVLQLPHQVGGIDGKQVVDIVGGEHHTLLLKSDGSLWGTGRNDDGQLGGLVKPARESYEEVRVPNSRVKVAGTNNYVNVTEDYMPNSFMRLPIAKGFQEIYSRSHYNYAINRSERDWPKTYSWGSGFNYVLGNGKEDTVSTPFRVSNKKLFKEEVPSRVALGFSHVAYFTGDVHEVELDEPKPRNPKKRDQVMPVRRKDTHRGKRVKSK